MANFTIVNCTWLDCPKNLNFTGLILRKDELVSCGSDIALE